MLCIDIKINRGMYRRHTHSYHRRGGQGRWSPQCGTFQRGILIVYIKFAAPLTIGVFGTQAQGAQLSILEQQLAYGDVQSGNLAGGIVGAQVAGRYRTAVGFGNRRFRQGKHRNFAGQFAVTATVPIKVA